MTTIESLFMKWKWCLCLLILWSNIAIAQLAPNQNPPGIKWKKIQADHFDVIVPEELTEEGQRVANTLEYLRIPLQKSLNVRMRKWQVLLSNRGAVSNGYVSLLPRRSEWFATPPQNDFSGTAEWYHLLAAHEGRHMAQFDKLNQGFTRFAGIFFGELGQGAFSFLSTPLWFMEGDAVAIETALSNSGRGRIPGFDLGMRALQLSGQQYSYYKAYLGSYKDYYPNFYHLGYHLVTHGRRQYGVDVWDEVINRSAKYSFWPFTFSRSMKKITGRNAKGIYKDTITELDSLWRQQIEGLEFTVTKKLNNRKKQVWTNYYYPQALPDGSVIALKAGFDDPFILVWLDPDYREKKLVQISPTDRISVNGAKICWAINNTDSRWWAQSFSDVAVYDIKTKKKSEITTEGKYFSPALSTDGQQIAAVKFTRERQCSLVILDSKTGSEIWQFENPNNYFFKTPVWSNDGKRLVFIRQKYNGEALTILDIESGEQKDILPEGKEDIGWPVFYGDYILYGSSYSGIANIYAVHFTTGERFQVTSRKFGAFYPAVSQKNDELIFSDYQQMGTDIVKISLEPEAWKPLKTIEQRQVQYYQPLISQEQGKNIMNTELIPNKQYPVTDYSPLKNSLNVHSWYLLPLPPNVYYGFISNDLLNTMEMTAGVTHHLGENVCRYSLGASYAGFRPIIDTELSWGKRAALYDYEGTDTTDVWDEFILSAGMRIPLDVSSGPVTTLWEYGLLMEYSRISHKEFTSQGEFLTGNMLSITCSVDHSSYRLRAYRDVRPRWGRQYNMSYSLSPFKTDYTGWIFSTSYRFYLPGLLKHHSLSGSAALELQYPDDYLFISRVPFTRGYAHRYYYLYRIGSLDYSFPLCYPDLAFGALLYIKRLRANLFYDYGVGWRNVKNHFYRSVGVELNIDFIPLSLYYLEIGAGIRYSYRIEDRDYRIEFILANFEF